MPRRAMLAHRANSIPHQAESAFDTANLIMNLCRAVERHDYLINRLGHGFGAFCEQQSSC